MKAAGKDRLSFVKKNATESDIKPSWSVYSYVVAGAWKWSLNSSVTVQILYTAPRMQSVK